MFQEPWDIATPLVFLVHETLSFHKKCQNQSCVSDLENQTRPSKH